MSRGATPGQTVGPFFGDALPYPGGHDLVPPGHPAAIRFHGLVLDGAGTPVPDALVELWQADPTGAVVRRPGSLARRGSDFTGWGRAATDADGHWSFTTVAPGATGPGVARHVSLTVFARGLLDRLLTRAYLDPPTDVPAWARAGMTATPEASGYRFDIVLQGERQTPFLAG